MAVIFDNLQKFSSSLNSQLPKMWGYTDLNTTLETMISSGFFNDFIGTTELEDDDLIYLKGLDGAFLYKYTLINAGTNTKLVHPSSEETAPLVYRYTLNSTFDLSSAGPKTRWIPIPRAGVIHRMSGVLSEGLTAFDVIQLEYIGETLTEMDFGNGISAGKGIQNEFTKSVESTAVSSPSGLLLRTNSLGSSARVYQFAIEIFVIETEI